MGHLLAQWVNHAQIVTLAHAEAVSGLRGDAAATLGM
jgi:hypothetical protein